MATKKFTDFISETEFADIVFNYMQPENQILANKRHIMTRYNLFRIIDPDIEISLTHYKIGTFNRVNFADYVDEETVKFNIVIHIWKLTLKEINDEYKTDKPEITDKPNKPEITTNKIKAAILNHLINYNIITDLTEYQHLCNIFNFPEGFDDLRNFFDTWIPTFNLKEYDSRSEVFSFVSKQHNITVSFDINSLSTDLDNLFVDKKKKTTIRFLVEKIRHGMTYELFQKYCEQNKLTNNKI